MSEKATRPGGYLTDWAIYLDALERENAELRRELEEAHGDIVVLRDSTTRYFQNKILLEQRAESAESDARELWEAIHDLTRFGVSKAVIEKHRAKYGATP